MLLPSCGAVRVRVLNDMSEHSVEGTGFLLGNSIERE